MQYKWKRMILLLPVSMLAFAGCVLQWKLQPGASYVFSLVICIATIFAAFMQKTEWRVSITAIALGLLLAAFLVVGHEIHYYETIERLLDPNEIPRAIVRIIGIAVLFSGALRFLYHGSIDANDEKKQTKLQYRTIWAAMFTCWLPYFVVFYPGCVSNDSLMEIQSMLGQLPLNNHHPLIHQWTIAPFVLLGQALGTLETGIALYTLFQMAVMSAIFAYALWDLGRRGSATWLRIVLFAWYGLHTVNAFYSISMWKDVLFGGFALLLVILLTRLCEDSKEKSLSMSKWLLLSGVLFLFCLYRNNGYYAFLFAMPFFVLFNRRWWKQLLTVGIVVFVAVNAYQTLIFDVLGAQKSKSGEALSVPLQQIARTVRYHHRSVSEEEMKVLEEIFPSVEEVRWAYIPHISDPVKDLFQADVFNENPMRYAKVWLQLGMRHPLVYLDAFLYQGHGYWYPNTPYWTVYYDIFENELGQSIQRNKATEALRSLHDRLEWHPVTSYLYHPATYVWLMLIACGLLLCKRRTQQLTPLLFLLGIWLTTLLSPVYAEYRYLYGVIVAAPYLLGLAQGEKRR